MAKKIESKTDDKSTMKVLKTVLNALSKLSKEQQKKVYSALGEVI
jgi:hypothetical protein